MNELVPQIEVRYSKELANTHRREPLLVTSSLRIGANASAARAPKVIELVNKHLLNLVCGKELRGLKLWVMAA
jgi:hypothetical protein